MKFLLLAAFVASSLKFYTVPNIWHLLIGGEPIRTEKQYFARLQAVGEDFPTRPDFIFTRFSLFPIVVRPASNIQYVVSNKDNSCTAYLRDPYPEKSYVLEDAPVVDFMQYYFLVTNRLCTRIIVSYAKPSREIQRTAPAAVQYQGGTQ